MAKRSDVLVKSLPRSHFGIAIMILLATLPTIGQQPQITGDEVVRRYLSAIGQSEWANVTSLIIKAEISGDLTTLISFYKPPKVTRESGTWESYYKSPNQRLSFVRTANNAAAWMVGCDGTQGWYFEPHVGVQDYKIKPGRPSICDSGPKLVPAALVTNKPDFTLKGTKNIDQRTCYAIEVNNVGSRQHMIFYFDADSFLLVQMDSITHFSMNPTAMSTTLRYSDYREIGRLKYPFKVETDVENTSTILTVREVKVNEMIDDSRFQKPKLR